jgi:hypothetical protein
MTYIPIPNLKPPKTGVSRINHTRATSILSILKPPILGGFRVSGNTYICTSHSLSNPPGTSSRHPKFPRHPKVFPPSICKQKTSKHRLSSHLFVRATGRLRILLRKPKKAQKSLKIGNPSPKNGRHSTNFFLIGKKKRPNFRRTCLQ